MRYKPLAKPRVFRLLFTILFRSQNKLAITSFQPLLAGVPESEALCEQVISLPMHPYLDESTQRQITDCIISSQSQP